MEPPPVLVRVLVQERRGDRPTAVDVPIPAVLLEQRRAINTRAAAAGGGA